MAPPIKLPVAAVSGVDEAGAQRKVGDVLTSRAA
jgi:hypothetical protein